MERPPAIKSANPEKVPYERYLETDFGGLAEPPVTSRVCGRVPSQIRVVAAGAADFAPTPAPHKGRWPSISQCQNGFQVLRSVRGGHNVRSKITAPVT